MKTIKTELLLSDFIKELRKEVAEINILENTIDFFKYVVHEEGSMEVLEELYKEEEKETVGFKNRILEIANSRDKVEIIALLDFINSCGDVHDDLYLYYFSNGDIYYCHKCGSILDLRKRYLITDEDVLCHKCLVK